MSDGNFGPREETLSRSVGIDVPTDDQTFSITELAELFGITARAIRFYEDHGLLSPMRRGQNRIYSRRDYARLAWVLRGKRVGFSLAEIREMLDLYDVDDGRTKQRMITLEKCRERSRILAEQRQDINHMIKELEQFCDTVSAMIATDKTR